MRDPVHQQTLDNGLRVVWEEDHRQPLVAIEARIIGGLREEGPYLGMGITHFLEHMLFKGTTTRAPGTIDQEVRRYGGSINAFTSHDHTGVTLYVESRYVREALAMLSDILQHAVFPEEEFQKERVVVISEIQMNRDDPERRISDLFWSHLFLVHPYRHPILGYLEQLKKLTAKDMATYYHSQYLPNNVVLACAGDIDSSTFPKIVQETFGTWERGVPYQQLVQTEPPTLSPREAIDELPVQAAYMTLGFPSTRLADPNLYALDVLAGILGQGRSSRLYEELVRKRQVAQIAAAANYTPFDPGAFTVYLRTEPSQAQAAIDATYEVIEAIKRDGVSAAELTKARRQVEADYLFRHQTIESVAEDLASSLAMTGDPAFSKGYVAGVDRVTADDVKRVANQYLVRTAATLAIIRPPAKAETTAPPTEERPNVTKTVLPNGLTVLIGVDRHLPLASIVVGGHGGVRVETEQRQGLSNLTAQMLLKGTSKRSASEIAAFVESLGGRMSAFSGRDLFGVGLDVLSGDVSQGLGLMQELITDSTFPAEEVALQEQLVLRELEARDDDVFDLASRRMRETLFKGHPYQLDPLGDKATIGKLRREDCQAFAKQWLTANNLVIGVFGDVNPDTVLADIRQRFGQLPKGQAKWPDRLDQAPLGGIREAVETRQKEQSVILLGFRGTRAASEDRYALDSLTAILSGMSGRLFQAVREKLGLSYTLGATDVPAWDQGYLVVYAATRPEERDKTLDGILGQLRLIVDQPVGDEELRLAKQYLIGAHRLDLQQLTGWGKRILTDELYGLGYDSWTQYETRINAVTPKAVQDAARRYLTLNAYAKVLVGPQPGGSPQPVAGAAAAGRDAR